MKIIGNTRFGNLVRSIVGKTERGMGSSSLLNLDDWSYVASTNSLHYRDAMNELRSGKNVILEKPYVENEEALNSLIKTATDRKRKIFFSMLNLYSDQIQRIEKPSKFYWTKDHNSKNMRSLLANLAFHDLYIYLNSMPDTVISDFDINISPNCNYNNIQFEISCKKDIVSFEYSYNKIGLNDRLINDFIIASGQHGIIEAMLEDACKADVELNHDLARRTTQLYLKIKSMLAKKVLVIGGGIFGCAAAIKLSDLGANVSLVERNEDIMQAASMINQYRIHRGYHYPRSDETAQQCQKSYKRFERYYSDCLVPRSNHWESYYAIANHGSKTNRAEFENFMDRHNLQYSNADLGLRGISATYLVNERLFDPEKLKNKISEQLISSGISLHTSCVGTRRMFTNYDHVIVATYAETGAFQSSDKIYQFELCEKPIVKLPEKWRGKSLVVMDGPFFCLDPFSTTEYHVLGNVEHAIIHSHVGNKAIIPKEYKNLINKGVVYPDNELTKFNEFISSASIYIPEIRKAQHIGSMFTIRTVEVNRESDDRRLTNVFEIQPNVFGIFSAKICTSTHAADIVASKYLENNG